MPRTIVKPPPIVNYQTLYNTVINTREKVFNEMDSEIILKKLKEIYNLKRTTSVFSRILKISTKEPAHLLYLSSLFEITLFEFISILSYLFFEEIQENTILFSEIVKNANKLKK
jgi:hypothetical protein